MEVRNNIISRIKQIFKINIQNIVYYAGCKCKRNDQRLKKHWQNFEREKFAHKNMFTKCLKT